MCSNIFIKLFLLEIEESLIEKHIILTNKNSIEPYNLANDLVNSKCNISFCSDISICPKLRTEKNENFIYKNESNEVKNNSFKEDDLGSNLNLISVNYFNYLPGHYEIIGICHGLVCEVLGDDTVTDAMEAELISGFIKYINSSKLINTLNYNNNNNLITKENTVPKIENNQIFENEPQNIQKIEGPFKAKQLYPYKLRPHHIQLFKNALPFKIESGLSIYKQRFNCSILFSLRLCTDYRKMNLMTIPDSYSLPNINEIFSSLVQYTEDNSSMYEKYKFIFEESRINHEIINEGNSNIAEFIKIITISEEKFNLIWKKSFYWIDRKRLFCENCQLNKRNEILFVHVIATYLKSHYDSYCYKICNFTLCIITTNNGVQFNFTKILLDLYDVYIKIYSGQCERWKQQDRIWGGKRLLAYSNHHICVEDSQNNNYVDRIINGAIPRDVIGMERVKYVPIIKENDSHKKAKEKGC
ncbi:hypothetical protein H8356DRAFT_1349492 [Neocallimastix lanati (nom. inval.)]|nr:hypothetical protein H8356DRAFT_1349492 [Neocallimastix sp. JGI-2020a]